MKYSFFTAVTFIKRSILNDIISIISISFAMVIPAIFITQYFTALNNYNHYTSMINLKDKLVLSVEANESTEGDIDTIEVLKYETSFIKEVYTFNRIDQEIVLYNNELITNADIRAISSNVKELYNGGGIYRGEWLFNKDDCMVGKEICDRYDIQIGDNLKVGVDEFTVKGMFDIPTQNQFVFIHKDGINNSSVLEEQYYIEIDGIYEESPDLLNLETYLTQYESSFDVSNQTEHLTFLRGRLSKGWTASIFLSIVAILYSVLNIGIIQSLYENENSKNLAIMSAIGANDKFIFVQEFFRVMLLSFFSSFCTYMILLFFEKYRILNIIEMDVNIQTFIFIWILSLLVLLIFIIRFFIRFKKITIREILQ